MLCCFAQAEYSRSTRALCLASPVPPKAHDSSDALRLDRWLWAARFYKTRPLASAAVKGGKIDVNGTRAKPAKLIRAGDELTIQKDPYRYVVVVRGLSDRRLSAPLAQALYEETRNSVANRELLGQQLKAQADVFRAPRARPSKRARRELERLRRGELD